MPTIATPEILSFVALSLALAMLLVCAAWGPGTHIQLTRELLERFERRGPRNEAQALVLAHKMPFLYGNIAADIINFKAYGGVKNHCHNWNIEERLAALAHTDAERAFILGYLCHLAADVVAHNHFVPYHLVYNFPPRMLGHAYWEAMADTRVTDEEWHSLTDLKRNRGLKDFDHMVHLAVERRALGLRSNRWIFNNILLLSCRRQWRDLVRSVANGERKHPLDESFHRRCRGESFRNMRSVFHPERLAVLRTKDPTGREALRGALRLRRSIAIDVGGRRNGRQLASELAASAYRISR